MAYTVLHYYHLLLLGNKSTICNTLGVSSHICTCIA
jgi:hypothetical protein